MKARSSPTEDSHRGAYAQGIQPARSTPTYRRVSGVSDSHLVRSAKSFPREKHRFTRVSPRSPREQHRGDSGSEPVRGRGRESHFSERNWRRPDTCARGRNNARQWTFGPLPEVATYPDCRTMVKYVYRLEGQPMSVIITNATIRTKLPNQIEIVARPFASDYPSPVKEGSTGAWPPH